MSEDDEPSQRKLRSLYQSVLVRHPDYLEAIGTLSIEVVNIDILLAHLLSAVLGIPRRIGDEIYFTPRANALRINILQNVARTALHGIHGYEKQTLNIAKRALAIADKRHKILHESWGFSQDGYYITRRALPLSRPAKRPRIPLTEITDVIGDTRQLVKEILALTRVLEQDEQYPPSPYKRNKQSRPEGQKTNKRRPPPDRTRKSPHRSSWE